MSLTLSSLALCTITFLYARATITQRFTRLPGAGGQGVGKLTGVGPVVHQEELEILLIADEQFSESILQHVSGLFSRSITDTWEGLVASESSTDSAINTVRESPRFLWINDMS